MISIVRAVGLCTIQDLGRRGHMHEAVPPGGALVPQLLVAANRGARNPDNAPAIEVLGRLVLRAERSLHVATDRDGSRILAAGAELEITSEPRRCAYLAVRGGIEAPVVLGGRGTLLCAKLGAPLRAGDQLAVADEPETPGSIEPFRGDGTIHVIAGPDLDAFASDALATLEQTAYRIEPTSDRVGTRLAGPALPRSAAYRERSAPMVIGAIEVPRDGQPIILGPEHPTTGGYPVLGVIASADLGRFFAIRIGGSVRFTAAR